MHKEIELKFRSVKKQQETIADKLIEVDLVTDEQAIMNQEVGDRVKTDFLKCTETLAIYKKKCEIGKLSLQNETLEAKTSAVTKMADALSSQKKVSHGLEKLLLPT